ncbi:LuxR C-terminal-related transcriptional regulator [Chamaesiphon sp. OTE_75_metabat_556]|uniref:LuxR C-terminal-related transcriptional regulator n=1 Tax=Chamaesiphon sp. OTE_75_metabat_556 TaxID=2964692 RepID=UPI00286A71A1|nr:LuxR C-terminal-related transcriptional regulator [Chamaesiphon sp. OTE_75_metabat_556]
MKQHITEIIQENKFLQIEIAKLKQTQQIAQRQTQMLCRTLSGLTAEPHIDRLLPQVLCAIAEQLTVSCCVLWLQDSKAETRCLRMLYSEGQILSGSQLLEYPRALKLEAIGKHPVWLTKSQDSPFIIIDDMANYSELQPLQREYIKDLGIKGLLEVSLIHNTKVIGCLAVYSTKHQRFCTTEVELVKVLTHQVNLAIQITHLADEVKQEVQQSTVVEERNRLAQELHNSLMHLQEVLTPNNTGHFDNVLDMKSVDLRLTQDYLLQDIAMERSTDKIRSLKSLNLTQKEQEILQMVASGSNNKEIAGTLCLSEGTIRNYISKILSRLNVRDRTQAALIANNFLS